MSVRVRVAVALIVAAVVPLIGVFALVGVLLPATVGSVDRQRLQEAASAATALLARECTAVGDRAALVASRLQARVSAADPAVDARQVVEGAAAGVVGSSVEEDWSVTVLDPDGGVLASGGPDGDRVAASPEDYLDRSCATGRLGEPPALVVALPVTVGSAALGTVLVVSALDAEAVTELQQAISLTDVDLAVIDGDEVVAAAPGLAATVDDAAGSAGEETDLLDRLAQRAAQAEPSGPTQVRAGRVADRPFVVERSSLGDVAVLAVREARASVDSRLALAFVVTAAGAAALVWLLSATLTRPLTELAELARRIAAGGAPSSTSVADGPADADADADVRGVSTVLADLARDLRASEADAERRRGELLDAFSRFGDALHQTHDRDGLLRTVLQAALLAAEAPMGLALHHDRSSRAGRRELSLRARTRGSDPEDLDDATRRRLSTVAERALAGRSVVELPGTEGLGPVLAVPLGSASRPLGAVVVARDPGAPGYDAVALEAIGALATNAGTALGNIKEHQEVERLSVTDPLTGVNNFRHLSTMLARELERASRFGHPLGVLMLDIDRFKPVNDTHGHAAGDAVLRELARRVKESVREVDTVARYGGEEFALVLPETDQDGAVALAGRVLTAIRSEQFRLPDGPSLTITASIGVAVFPADGANATEVMRAADEALYRAKSGGRDRVEVAAPAALAGRTRAPGSAEGDVSP